MTSVYTYKPCLRILTVVTSVLFLLSVAAVSAQQCMYGSSCVNGQGTYKFADGSTYTGSFSNGQLHGAGTYWFRNGDVYKGPFLKGVRTGFGTFWFADGSKYVGAFQNNQFNGTGTLTQSSGSVTKGTFKNGKVWGKGEWSSTKGDTYSGEFADGQFSGFGTRKFSNGAEYSGQFRKGHFWGTGTLQFANGGIYKGDFVEGKLTSTGEQHWGDGWKYFGRFKDGKFHGFGKRTSPSGKIEEGLWEAGLLIVPKAKKPASKPTGVYLGRKQPGDENRGWMSKAVEQYKENNPELTTTQRSAKPAVKSSSEPKTSTKKQSDSIKEKSENSNQIPPWALAFGLGAIVALIAAQIATRNFWEKATVATIAAVASSILLMAFGLENSLSVWSLPIVWGLTLVLSVSTA